MFDYVRALQLYGFDDLDLRHYPKAVYYACYYRKRIERSFENASCRARGPSSYTNGEEGRTLTNRQHLSDYKESLGSLHRSSLRELTLKVASFMNLGKVVSPLQDSRG